MTQLTAEPGVPGAHVYMEAQIFLRIPAGSSCSGRGRAMSRRRTIRSTSISCAIWMTGVRWPVTEEVNAVAPSFSPDGRWIYYFLR